MNKLKIGSIYKDKKANIIYQVLKEKFPPEEYVCYEIFIIKANQLFERGKKYTISSFYNDVYLKEDSKIINILYGV